MTNFQCTRYLLLILLLVRKNYDLNVPHMQVTIQIILYSNTEKFKIIPIVFLLLFGRRNNRMYRLLFIQVFDNDYNYIILDRQIGMTI